MTRVAVTVSAIARAPVRPTFDAIVPVDLTRIFRGYAGVLPAVTGVREQTGPWDRPGASRVVELSDGSEAAERLTAVARPGSFGYVVGPFSGALGRVVDHADGRWRFVAAGDDTDVRWTYTFVARPGMGPVVRLIAPIWRRYARRVLAAAVHVAEERAEAARA